MLLFGFLTLLHRQTHTELYSIIKLISDFLPPVMITQALIFAAAACPVTRAVPRGAQPSQPVTDQVWVPDGLPGQAEAHRDHPTPITEQRRYVIYTHVHTCMHAAPGLSFAFRGEADIFNTLWLMLRKELPAAAASTFTSLRPWGRAVSSKQEQPGHQSALCFRSIPAVHTNHRALPFLSSLIVPSSVGYRENLSPLLSHCNTATTAWTTPKPMARFLRRHHEI